MTLKEALESLKIAFVNFEQTARSDDKTPLQNALALGEARENFAIADNNPNVVIFADINNFKSVNDGYGYDAGDAAINQIGTLIQEVFVEKCEAQAFRQSGDEFIVLLQNQYLTELKSIASVFKSCNVQFGEKLFSVGMSFGYAVSDGMFEFETIRARAETSCKEAKKQGDGICVEWTEEIERKALRSFRKSCSNCNAVTSCFVPQEMNLNAIQFCAACGAKFS